MRIAFYSPRSTHLEHGLEKGGDPIFLHELFAGLRRAGHEVEVVSRLNVHDLWRGRVPARRLLTEALAVRRRQKQLRPDAWLVYKPSRTYPDLFGWWQRPKRYVLIGAHTWQSRRIPRVWRSFLAWAYRRTLRRADFVTVLLPQTLERLQDYYGVEPERARLLFTAVPVPADVPAQDDARRRLGLPVDVPIVLSTTRLTEPGSGQGKTEMILDLLSVAPSLPADALVVVGGDGPGRGAIEAEVRRLRLQERVRLVGAVERADTTWYFAACDVYVQPHPLDGPWLSVLEAQAVGRPVVTMHTRSGELTVDVGGSGLLARTIDDFGDHVRALTADRDRSAAMGRRARQFILDAHSIDVRVRQIEELLEAGRPRPQHRPDRVRTLRRLRAKEDSALHG
jgi:glycosyltransferase involved in cell wall biosynthesis